ncbi:hypothetical protein GCM10009608_76800 [Pseudonocardia alaniniphila]
MVTSCPKRAVGRACSGKYPRQGSVRAADGMAARLSPATIASTSRASNHTHGLDHPAQGHEQRTSDLADAATSSTDHGRTAGGQRGHRTGVMDPVTAGVMGAGQFEPDGKRAREHMQRPWAWGATRVLHRSDRGFISSSIIRVDVLVWTTIV